MAVEIARDGRVTIITLDRPEKRNALDPPMHAELRHAFTSFADDDDAWVAVLAGRGPDFCAGVDLGAWRGERRAAPWAGITRDFQCWKPIIAALQGNVLGGGFELALCADLRVADETARLGSPEVKWGAMQGAGATQRLPRSVPFAIALELLLTGEPIDAARAERIGLVNRVVPAGKALEGALELAATLLARAPLALRRSKEAAYRGYDLTLEDGLRLEELLSHRLAGTADLAEGGRAYAEHRPPRWEGR